MFRKDLVAAVLLMFLISAAAFTPRTTTSQTNAQYDPDMIHGEI